MRKFTVLATSAFTATVLAMIALTDIADAGFSFAGLSWQ